MKIRFLASLFLAAAASAFAAQPKEYQVTGPIVALTDDVITVDKSGEKWEIGRSAATKVVGKLAVGSKVTVYYRMAATSVDVKDAPKAAGQEEKAPKKKK